MTGGFGGGFGFSGIRLPSAFGDLRSLIVQSVVTLCVVAVLLAVLADFLLFNQRSEIRQGQKAIVRTSTMLAFFAAYFLVVRFRVGQLPITSKAALLAADVAGLLLLAAGAAFNILGRLQLKQNWGDNIRIYTDHTLVTTGPYRLVRHPLYASLIWMFTGGALVYRNFLALLLNLLVFVPFMTWRARQEEKLLLQSFSGICRLPPAHRHVPAPARPAGPPLRAAKARKELIMG